MSASYELCSTEGLGGREDRNENDKDKELGPGPGPGPGQGAKEWEVCVQYLCSRRGGSPKNLREVSVGVWECGSTVGCVCVGVCGGCVGVRASMPIRKGGRVDGM